MLATVFFFFLAGDNLEATAKPTLNLLSGFPIIFVMIENPPKHHKCFASVLHLAKQPSAP